MRADDRSLRKEAHQGPKGVVYLTTRPVAARLTMFYFEKYLRPLRGRGHLCVASTASRGV